MRRDIPCNNSFSFTIYGKATLLRRQRIRFPITPNVKLKHTNASGRFRSPGFSNNYINSNGNQSIRKGSIFFIKAFPCPINDTFTHKNGVSLMYFVSINFFSISYFLS